MTTPVFMNLPDAKNTDTQNNFEQRQMSFVIPSGNIENTPQPNSKNVVINSFPKREVAVISFSGRWKEQSFKDKEKILRSWLEEKGFAANEKSYAAAYDPPWAVPFLRKNEVHIEIDFAK